MSLVTFLFGGEAKDSIGGFELDVTLDETHSWANEITDNPVEEGVPSTDFIAKQPDIITMRGLASTASLGQGLLTFVQFGTADNVQEAFDALYRLKESGEPVTVTSKLKTYKDMVVRTVDIPRTPNIGEAIQYTVELKHVRRVTSKTAEVPEGIGTNQADSVGTKAKPEAKKGQQQNTPAPESSKSLLSDMLS